jgi:hypothetical protein
MLRTYAIGLGIRNNARLQQYSQKSTSAFPHHSSFNIVYTIDVYTEHFFRE